MRSSEAMPCPRHGPRSGALHALSSLDSFPNHRLPPETASSCLCPTALLCLRQPMERDFLASGASLFCLKTLVYACTASKPEQGRLTDSLLPSRRRIRNVRGFSLFFSSLFRAMQLEGIELEYAEFS